MIAPLEPDRPRRARSRLVRGALAAVGTFLVGLAAAGAVLPVLPTTPFLLLAAACFVRSSPRLHERLLASRLLGPYLREWRASRTVPPAAKRKAIVLVVLSFTLSIVVVDVGAVRVLLAVLGAALALFLARLPTRAAPEPPARGLQAARASVETPEESDTR